MTKLAFWFKTRFSGVSLPSKHWRSSPLQKYYDPHRRQSDDATDVFRLGCSRDARRIFCGKKSFDSHHQVALMSYERSLYIPVDTVEFEGRYEQNSRILSWVWPSTFNWSARSEIKISKQNWPASILSFSRIHYNVLNLIWDMTATGFFHFFRGMTHIVLL